MTKQGRAVDKLLEAKYFLDQLQDAIDGLLRRSEPRSVADFRYRLSAFVSAARSVTWVLQAQFRATGEDEFEEWWLVRRQKLRRHVFAKTLLEMRNIGQKEGNRLPIL